MFHLFGRTYIDHDVFYNSKYIPIIISSVEKPHPISEKIGEPYGKVRKFEDFLQEEHKGELNHFWDYLIQNGPGKKTVLYADHAAYTERLIEYYKSVFENPEADFVFELYELQHADKEIKLLMDVDRGDNIKSVRPGEIPKYNFGDFEKIYDSASVISPVRNMPKNDLGFELLLAESHLSPNSALSMFFSQRLIRLTWRTWLSDLYSLRNDIFGSLYYLDRNSNIREFIKTNPLFKCFMDVDFNEKNSHYILKSYQKVQFKELFLTVNPQGASGENPWSNFLLFTDLLFEGKYYELLEADIQNRKGCTYIRNHLTNESNQLLASKIYEDIRLSNFNNLKRFKLA